MLPTRLDLASSGLRTAIQEIALGEERAHAFLDTYQHVPRERRTKLPQALAALDRVDAALHEFRAAVRELEAESAQAPAPAPLVQMRERRRPPAIESADSSLMAP